LGADAIKTLNEFYSADFEIFEYEQLSLWAVSLDMNVSLVSII
jgi:hypothetical protein